jgi:hypothetical protein
MEPPGNIPGGPFQFVLYLNGLPVVVSVVVAPMRIGMVVTSIVGVVVAIYSSEIIAMGRGVGSEIVAVPLIMWRVVIASPEIVASSEVITMRGRIASEIVTMPVGVIVTPVVVTPVMVGVRVVAIVVILGG